MSYSNQTFIENYEIFTLPSNHNYTVAWLGKTILNEQIMCTLNTTEIPNYPNNIFDCNFTLISTFIDINCLQKESGVTIYQKNQLFDLYGYQNYMSKNGPLGMYCLTNGNSISLNNAYKKNIMLYNYIILISFIIFITNKSMIY